jgi:hypothetical protein
MIQPKDINAIQKLRNSMRSKKSMQTNYSTKISNYDRDEEKG